MKRTTGDVRKATLMGLLFCVVSPAAGRCADPVPVPDQINLEVLAGEAWFRASLMGKPVGYLHTKATPKEATEGRGLQTVEEMSIKIDFGQGPMDVSATTVTDYGPDLKPRHIRSEQNEFGRAKIVEASVHGNSLLVRSKAGDLETDKTFELGQNFGSELALSLAAAESLLPARATYAFQAFVPELEMLVDFEAECLDWETVDTPQGQMRALKVVFRARRIGLEIDSWIDGQGNTIRQQMPQLMNLLVERVTEDEALSVVAPFTLADHIPVTERMGSARSLTYVRLKATSAGLPASELVPQTHLQTVRALGGQEAEITVVAETEQGLSGHRLPLEAPALEEFLVPNAIVQSDDPAIVAKAREIVGEEIDAWEAAKKLIRWVHDNMTPVDHDPRPITASECLRLMKGDCSEYATLLCALARAVGIPSKFVTGVVYLDNGYYYHAWNELYVGRWVACDPTWGETVCNAGHLTLASGSLTGESFAKTNLDAVRCMGVLALEVLEHRNSRTREGDEGKP